MQVFIQTDRHIALTEKQRERFEQDLAKAMGRDRVVDRTSAKRAAAAGREHASLPLHSAVV